MIFVTTGQKIAVENFSKGAIYKVTFTDESISYMMCVGIGKDFVMLQSANPSLFALTMQSASRVSTIDIHDPTPPEPPTPLENVLQYQTGAPPFTFTTTESSLFSWYIEGAAGVKTANLLNPEGSWTDYGCSHSVSGGDITVTGRWFSYLAFTAKPNTTYSMECNNVLNQHIGVYKNAVSGTPLATTYTNFIKFTTDTDTQLYIVFYANSGGEERTVEYKNVRLFEGDYTSQTIPAYEPYGKYKISIYNNEHTTTIYLDEPIGEGEKLYSVNIDAQIETDIGENTLSVSDPQPPEMQIIYGIYAEG